MNQKDNDLKKIKELIDVMKENDLVELELKHNDDKILLKRSGFQQPAVTTVPLTNQSIPSVSAPGTSQDAAAEKTDESLVEIVSPIVGTFYSQPGPDSENYVEPGSPVTEQTVVCIIEAMKVMNEIKAETTGTIVETLLSNGQAVEFGQPLYRVKPD